MRHARQLAIIALVGLLAACASGERANLKNNEPAWKSWGLDKAGL